MGDVFDRIDRQAFLDDLTERFEGDLKGCPFCESKNWIPLPGLVHVEIESQTPRNRVSMPAVGMICGHCSFLRVHTVSPAMDSLGLTDLSK